MKMPLPIRAPGMDIEAETGRWRDSAAKDA